MAICSPSNTNLLFIFLVGWFVPIFDKYAEQGEDKKITKLHYGLGVLNGDYMH